MIENAVLAALNHLLNQADWARQRLAPFAGRHVRVSMPPWLLCLQVIEDGWFGVAAGDDVCDVEVALPADTPLHALQGIDKLVQAARIEGNAQFAAELAFVLKNLRWDYEEDLSRLVGDIAAHRLATSLGAFANRHKRTLDRAAERFARYATETRPLLAGHTALQQLAADIAETQSLIDQAERRLTAVAVRRPAAR